ncbi:MAG TPA: TetR/AcrR family transcriptional regulator [Rhodanobacter sp.]|jgi:AcrR family transcriptional regulator|nr:TetR/AcrR family transcriptional regulator [Rhodanobacter sp.]
MNARKDELTESLIAYLLENGLADLSLRPLAAGTGTSARLLIYHFGSKEGLLTEVLEAMQTHVRKSFAQLLDKSSSDKRAKPPLKQFWNWAIADENYPYLKLLYELQILAIQNPDTYAQYLERNTVNWLDLALEALSPSGRTPALATLCTAVFDGLFIELMSSGDRKRTTRAIDYFIQMATESLASRPEA